MPQHSFGASARAWATTSSSSRREMRSGLLGGGGGAVQLHDVVVVLVATLGAERLLELAHAPAHRAAHLGQALGSQHDEGDDEDDDQLHRPDVHWHGMVLSPRSAQGSAPHHNVESRFSISSPG